MKELIFLLLGLYLGYHANVYQIKLCAELEKYPIDVSALLPGNLCHETEN